MHNLIVGVSGSGKSNLAKAIARDTPADRELIVYDPTASRGWPERAAKYSTAEPFLEHVENAERARVFIDEGRTLWDYDVRRADRLLYQGRHRGLLCFVIAQRTAMIPPNARNQCSRVFSFKQQHKDAEKLEQEYSTAFGACRECAPGHFICGDGFRQLSGRLEYYAQNQAKITF